MILRNPLGRLRRAGRPGNLLGDIEILVFPNPRKWPILRVDGGRRSDIGRSARLAGQKNPDILIGVTRANGLARIRKGTVGEEVADVQDAPNQGPDVRDVGDNHGRAGFTDIPFQPFLAVRDGQTVILGQDGANDDEDTEGENAAEDGLFPGREPRPDEDWQRDEHHQQVRGDV